MLSAINEPVLHPSSFPTPQHQGGWDRCNDLWRSAHAKIKRPRLVSFLYFLTRRRERTSGGHRAFPLHDIKFPLSRYRSFHSTTPTSSCYPSTGSHDDVVPSTPQPCPRHIAHNPQSSPLSDSHCRHDEASFPDAPAPRARPNTTATDWHLVPNSEQQCQNANVQTHQRSLVRVFSAWFLLRDQKTHTKSTTVSYLSISLSCFLSGPIPVLLHPSPPSQALHSLPPSSVHPRASQMPQYFTCHQAIQWG